MGGTATPAIWSGAAGVAVEGGRIEGARERRPAPRRSVARSAQSWSTAHSSTPRSCSSGPTSFASYRFLGSGSWSSTGSRRCNRARCPATSRPAARRARAARRPVRPAVRRTGRPRSSFRAPPLTSAGCFIHFGAVHGVATTCRSGCSFDASSTSDAASWACGTGRRRLAVPSPASRASGDMSVALSGSRTQRQPSAVTRPRGRSSRSSSIRRARTAAGPSVGHRGTGASPHLTAIVCVDPSLVAVAGSMGRSSSSRSSRRPGSVGEDTQAPVRAPSTSLPRDHGTHPRQDDAEGAQDEQPSRAVQGLAQRASPHDYAGQCSTPRRSKYASTSSSSHCRDSRSPSASIARYAGDGRGVLDVVDPMGSGEQQHRHALEAAHLDERLVVAGTGVMAAAVDASDGRPRRAGRPPAGCGASPAPRCPRTGEAVIR